MDKSPLHTPDFTKENIEKLAQLFPNCVTEATSEDGTLSRQIDFDLLRQELSGNIIEGPLEHYQLNWPGKREALLTANLPITRTLRPCREESVNFDTTQNLYIEGDNLDALKLLQETYLGKVKMIYIDPPYNTGNDFIYKDNFAEDASIYLERSNQKDSIGNRLVANNEANGRFHSDWLSMIYPRLKLARNLLQEDGVIFISIDDHEQANLKRLCDEVLGEENFLTCISVKLSESTGVKMAHASKRIPKLKEYILLYQKSDNIKINPSMIDKEKWDSEYRTVCLGLTKNELQFIKDTITNDNRNQKDLALVQTLLNKASFQAVTTVCKEETNNEISDDWLFLNSYRIIRLVAMTGGARTLARVKKESFTQLPPAFFIVTPKNKAYLIKSDFNHQSDLPRCKILFSDQYLQINSGDFWFDIKTTGLDNEGGINFKNGKKPIKLLKRCVNLVSQENDIILDFFSGSASTAHAVMKLNAEDGGKRKFIMVQLPEVCDEKSEAFKAGYKTIAEIGKDRIRRAGQKIKAENAITAPDLDIGFRVLKIDSSNMNEVSYNPDAVQQGNLLEQIDNIRPDRTAEDLLFQVLLDWGVDLSLPITKQIIAGNTVYFVDGDALAACFDTNIPENLVRELAKHKPLRVVFRDSGFASDAIKINVEQIFKTLSPSTDIKVI
jgi:adenine-specific DNA-methyltransferase